MSKQPEKKEKDLDDYKDDPEVHGKPSVTSKPKAGTGKPEPEPEPEPEPAEDVPASVTFNPPHEDPKEPPK